MERYSYEIITDTCSNLTDAQAEKYDIRIIGFPYTINGELHTDDPAKKTFDNKEVYELLSKKADVRTSLINSNTLEEFFEPFLKEGKDILYLCISGGISGTYQNAIFAANNLSEKYSKRKIIVVDCLSGSYAQGIVAVKTSKKRKLGATIEEAAEYAENLRYFVTHDFTIDNLFFLKRSGRVSNSTALIGTLAMIKPMFTLNKTGDLIVYSKVNGRKKALSLIMENFIKNIDPTNADCIGIVHGNCEKEAESLRDKVVKMFPKAEIFFDYLTPLVGSHTGPGAIGLLYIAKSARA